MTNTIAEIQAFLERHKNTRDPALKAMMQRKREEAAQLAKREKYQRRYQQRGGRRKGQR